MRQKFEFDALQCDANTKKINIIIIESPSNVREIHPKLNCKSSLFTFYIPLLRAPKHRLLLMGLT